MNDKIIENPGRTMWRDAARDGGILGLLLLATMCVNGFMEFRMSALIGVINFVLLVGCIYIFTRKRSHVYGDSGFSFAQSMGYIVIMMLFTGLITGIGDYMATNILWPEYYEGMVERVLEINPFMSQVSDDVYGRTMTIMNSLLENPLYHIFNGIIGKIIYGGIVGLFISAIVKRAPRVNSFGDAK